MSTIKQELKKLKLSDTNIKEILKLCENTELSTEDELFKFLNELPQDYVKCKNVLQTHLRYSKLIPFRDINSNQAFQLFTMIANKFHKKNIKILFEYFSGNETCHSENTIISILSDQIEKQTNLLECLSLLYYINKQIKEEEEEEEEEQEKVEQEKVEQEKVEQEKVEQEKVEQEKVEQEKVELEEQEKI